jgi:hypothetical protein
MKAKAVLVLLESWGMPAYIMAYKLAEIANCPSPEWAEDRWGDKPDLLDLINAEDKADEIARAQGLEPPEDEFERQLRVQGHASREAIDDYLNSLRALI